MSKVFQGRAMVTCPYCGVEQPVPVRGGVGMNIALCDCEKHGGCDRYFVLRWQRHYTTTAHKIEGQQVAVQEAAGA